MMAMMIVILETNEQVQVHNKIIFLSVLFCSVLMRPCVWVECVLSDQQLAQQVFHMACNGMDRMQHPAHWLEDEATAQGNHIRIV